MRKYIKCCNALLILSMFLSGCSIVNEQTKVDASMPTVETSTVVADNATTVETITEIESSTIEDTLENVEIMEPTTTTDVVEEIVNMPETVTIESLVNYYKNDFKFYECEDDDLVIVKPDYDEDCYGLIQEVSMLELNREAVWHEFSDV